MTGAKTPSAPSPTPSASASCWIGWWRGELPEASGCHICYLYTRAHHQFFGWLVAITASAHAIYFLVFSRESPPRWTLTGLAAWAALGLLVLIGLLIDRARRHRRSIRRIEPLHIGAALLFVALFVVHVA
jgi:hypothetical protein